MPARVGAASAPHAVYRCYDITDALLYIGCSSDLRSRFTQHEGHGALWLPFAEGIDVEWQEDRLAGLRAEKAAIERSLPLFNRTSQDWDDLGGGFPERGRQYLADHPLPEVPHVLRGMYWRRAYVPRTAAVAAIRGVRPQPWPIPK